jgi:hypothetical protein
LAERLDRREKIVARFVSKQLRTVVQAVLVLAALSVSGGGAR